MTNSKQLIVLSGGGRKGIVKLTAMAGSAKGTCSLDFRPAGATLYLVGDDIAQIPLKDMATAFDVPFLSNGEASCLVRSSSLTMFGGALPHSEIIKRVDSHLKSAAKPSPAPNAASDDFDTSRQDKTKDRRKTDLQDDRTDECGADRNNETTYGDYSDAISDETAGEDAMPSDQRFEKAESDHTGRNAYPHDKKSEGSGARSALSDIMSERDRFDGNNFYSAVKPQLDEMFVCYPEEPLLSATVERSKWVRVDASDGEYAVGILFDGDDPAFICYAVPARTSRRPPAEIEDMCVWLPVSSREIAGYWVIYQSAKTGEIIK